MSAAEAIARLLDLLDALEHIARHMHPPEAARLIATLGDRDAELRAALATAQWPEALREPIAMTGEYLLRACDGLRTVQDIRQVYRALRNIPRALEALYPLADVLPSVNRCFFTSDGLSLGPRRSDARTGVRHVANETTQRGGFSLYVPEDYDDTNHYPLVMALHGGSGHGRLFLWSWLREVRGRGVILVSPTATGDTWSLMEPQTDGAHLIDVLETVAHDWRVDRSRLLLTGMSDGGTFTLLSGLHEASPFTHLAPVAASFHPLLLGMATPERLKNLPVYLVHGALDWMFPVAMAQTARDALTAAGANVTYREIAELSHVYPREEGSAILDWFLGWTQYERLRGRAGNGLSTDEIMAITRGEPQR